MRIVILALVCLIALANTASAGLIFTLAPDTVDTFTAGQQGTFNVFVRSDVVAGERVIAMDVNIFAGAGDGTHGTFLSGTTELLSKNTFDVSAPGQAFCTNTGPAILIPFADGVGANRGVHYGTLILDTTGIAPGTYNMTFDYVDATPENVGLIISSSVSTSYTIMVNAVPEPTSMALIGLAGVVAVRRFRQRTKRS